MSDFQTFPQLVSAHNAAFRPMQAALSKLEGARNCCPAGGAGLANWWLRLQAEQNGDPEPPLVTHHAFRVAAGDPKKNGQPIGLSTTQALKALTSFGVPAKRHYGASYTVVRDALKAGAAVGVCVDYAYINTRHKALSGQRTFNGGHFVDLFGWSDGDGVNTLNTTTSHDSLFDGRTKEWGTAPQGPQTAWFSAYRGAMGAFRVGGATYAQGKPIGTDKGVFVVVMPPVPPVPEPETDAEKITRLEAELAECKGDT